MTREELGFRTVVSRRSQSDLLNHQASGGGSGSERNDVLLGSPGHDHLAGGSGDDLMKGRGGADFLKGGRGDDAAVGGPGYDRCLTESRQGCESF